MNRGIKISKTRSNIILRLSSLLNIGSSARTRLKTFARLSQSYKTTHSIETDRGIINFRIDSPGSVPQDVDSDRSEPETFEWIRQSILIEVKGKNLEENLNQIETITTEAGLQEDVSWRNKGSGRNRLYRRKDN